VCGYVTYTDYKKGEANLARIKQGGALAKLAVGFPEGSATLIRMETLQWEILDESGWILLRWREIEILTLRAPTQW